MTVAKTQASVDSPLNAALYVRSAVEMGFRIGIVGKGTAQKPRGFCYLHPNEAPPLYDAPV